MKAKPENNLPHSTTEGNQSKKILLFTTCDKFEPLLLREIESDDHLVMETVTAPDLLIQEIARTTPHLLIVHNPVESDFSNFVQTKIRLLFAGCPVSVDSWVDS